jgi:hypothetical protein
MSRSRSNRLKELLSYSRFPKPGEISALFLGSGRNFGSSLSDQLHMVVRLLKSGF